MPTTADSVFLDIVKKQRIEENRKTAEKAIDWNGSPFLWIRTHSSRKKGALGEQLVWKWLEANGFAVEKSTKKAISNWLAEKRLPDTGCKASDADLIVNGVPVEVKLSTQWEGGFFAFQQLRRQNYGYAFFLGLTPNSVHSWFLPKKTILARWDRNSDAGKDRRTLDDIVNQHASGPDTAWLRFHTDRPPKWLGKFGGSLSKGLAVVSKFLPPSVVAKPAKQGGVR